MKQLITQRLMGTVEDIHEATVEAGRRRIWPCLMTAFTTFAALLPVTIATPAGPATPRIHGSDQGLSIPRRRIGARRLKDDEEERNTTVLLSSFWRSPPLIRATMHRSKKPHLSSTEVIHPADDLKNSRLTRGARIGCRFFSFSTPTFTFARVTLSNKSPG